MPSSPPISINDVPLAPRKADEDVWSYPRPPLLQRVPNRLQVIWFHPPSVSASGSGGGERRQTVIAETTEALRVCETSHPPTYYLPPSSLRLSDGVKLDKTAKRSFCEWKGQATYWTLNLSGPAPEGGSQGDADAGADETKVKVENRIWSYESPTARFVPLKGYLSFYASSSATAARDGDGKGGEWRCFVDGEEVGIQEGDFYGGWITSNIKGKMKGGPGTWGW